MDDLFDAPAQPIPRDRWDRPLVIPPDGGKPKPYARCTTFVSALESHHTLTLWEKRMVALGLSERADLLLAVAAHRDDKRELNKICDQAKEAARASSAATTGTALHALTERVDRGQPLPALPESAADDLAAYTQATRNIEVVDIERFGVEDQLCVGGTWDRVFNIAGQYYIGDIKTGNIEAPAMKIAMQLAVYAHATPYDWTSGTRKPYDFTLNQERGVVVHLPAGTGTCQLHWIDIAAGWQAVQLAREVRQWRSKKDWYEPLELTPVNRGLLDDYIARAQAATSLSQLMDLYAHAEAEGVWNEELKAVFSEKKKDFQ